MIAVGDRAGDAHRRSRWNDVSPHDRTWRGHRDPGKLGGGRRSGILSHCAAAHSADQQPTRARDAESTSRKKRHGHIPIKAAALFVIADEFGKRLPSMRDGPIAVCPRMDRPHMTWRIPPGVIELSMSGEGRSARLESDAGAVQMSELGVSAQV